LTQKPGKRDGTGQEESLFGKDAVEKASNLNLISEIKDRKSVV
jgi:hypothetical protein